MIKFDSMFIQILVELGISLICGAIISFGYIMGNTKRKFSKQFAITTIILPAITAVVITLIGSDLAKAVSLGGVFALVRFRSIPGNSRDITYVFFAMAAGLAVGVNYYFIALAVSLLLSVVFVALEKFFNRRNEKIAQVLKITIPEDMNFKGAFDDIFEKYLEKNTLHDVRTTNMGTLFNITYNIEPKRNFDAKAFIDEIRTRNGNLNVVISDPDLISTQIL